jgi:hypothetical protein
MERAEVMRSLRLSLLLSGLVMGLLVGCAHAPPKVAPMPEEPPLPGYLLDPIGSPHPACPRQTHVVAVGISVHSAQSAFRDGQARLIKGIAVDMKVQSKSMINRRSRTTGAGERWSEAESYEQKVLADAQFGHMELLFPAGDAERRRNEWYRLVCLDRGDAAQALDADLEPGLLAFKASSTQMVEARAKIEGEHPELSMEIPTNPLQALQAGLEVVRTGVDGLQQGVAYGEIIVHFTQSVRDFEQLLPLFIQYRGVTSRAHPEEAPTLRAMANNRNAIRGIPLTGPIIELGLEQLLNLWTDGGTE